MRIKNPLLQITKVVSQDKEDRIHIQFAEENRVIRFSLSMSDFAHALVGDKVNCELERWKVDDTNTIVQGR